MWQLLLCLALFYAYAYPENFKAEKLRDPQHGTPDFRRSLVLSDEIFTVRGWQSRRYYDEPGRIIRVQPAPWSRCCVLG